jgi:hypothetical protein
MNPQAARRELFSSRLVLVSSSGLAAVTAFSAALGGGFGSGVAGGAILLRRAGREKHGGSSQSNSKETDHREVSVGNARTTKARARRPISLLAVLDRSWWWRWWLGSAGDDDDRGREGKECVFHSVVFVVFVVVLTACSGAHGISEK